MFGDCIELLTIEAYHVNVRRLIFILMIAMLPLQGWTSVAMATEMATMQLASTQSRSAAASMDMSPECALRMSATSSQDAASEDVSSKVCTDCQACHFIALTESLQVVNKAIFSVSFERTEPYYFASADLSLSQKPPIFSA